MTEVIRIHNVSVCFANIPVFESIHLSIANKEKITIAGPSGSGKSTLVRCIMGFVPIATGSVFINNVELTPRSVWRLRAQMAFVAQEPELGDGTVREALTRPFSYHANRHIQYSETEALRLFEHILLPCDLMDKETSALSGGEKQRVALVGALLLQRPILLLDEAASALDETSKTAVRDFLTDRTDLTILSVSHDTRGFAFSGPVTDITRMTRKAAS